MLKNVSNAHSSGFTYCIVTINMYVHTKVNHKNKHMDMFTYNITVRKTRETFFAPDVHSKHQEICQAKVLENPSNKDGHVV
jgi:hypothetical protein